MPPLLTVPEVAPMLRLSVRRAYELAAAGSLPGLRKLGPRTYRVASSELEAFLGEPVTPAATAPAHTRGEG